MWWMNLLETCRSFNGFNRRPELGGPAESHMARGSRKPQLGESQLPPALPTGCIERLADPATAARVLTCQMVAPAHVA